MIEPGVTEEVISEAPVESLPKRSAQDSAGELRSSPGQAAAPADTSSSPPAENFAELRYLLLGKEQDQLSRLQQRLDDPKTKAQEISQALPRAIQLRPPDDRRLVRALTPTVEESISTSVRTNPKRLSVALSPIIGPAIRAAVAHTLSSMIQSLNETLNSSFSVQGFKWRVEAWRTGKQFAEIVLLKTLRFRVEQALLIHKETGLSLLQAIAPAIAVQDPQIVSSMLTAIRDFVHDSFTVRREESLEQFEVGELEVWIEQGPQAVLAAVIRGEAPEDLRLLFQEVLEHIHQQHTEALENFDGDDARFESSLPELERCLQSQLTTKTDSEKPKRFSPLLIAIPLLLLLPLLIWMFLAMRDQRRWNDYVRRLQAEPGIVVVNAERRSGGYFITGLRDPLANDPAELLRSTALDQNSVSSRWEPYIALTPQFIEARARRLLEAPETVALKFDQGMLSASGNVTTEWLAEARQRALFLSGVTGFQSDQDNLLSFQEKLAKTLIGFATGSSELSDEQRHRLIALAAEIARAGRTTTAQFKVEITGHADETGTAAINRQLREQRAEAVRKFLVASGINAERLSVNDSSLADQSLRAVTFRLILNR